MRILITGISGFVARHFLALLNEVSPGAHVLGIYHQNQPTFDRKHFPLLSLDLKQIDIVQKGLLNDAVIDFMPHRVLHLAAQSSVGLSWKSPADTIIGNITMFLNLVEVVREAGINPRILSIGSSEEYGQIPEGKFRLSESDPSNPTNPYGTARVIQRKSVEMYHQHFGLDILHTRSFNHFGPYQTDRFVISSFAKQVARQLLDNEPVLQLTTGNTEIARDFTDVRDVVKAYWSLFEKGEAGQVYNVCSGKGTKLSAIIDLMSEVAGKPIEVKPNPDFFRPNDVMHIEGDIAKVIERTGWQPRIPMKQSLLDIINWWKEELSKDFVKPGAIHNNIG